MGHGESARTSIREVMKSKKGIPVIVDEGLAAESRSIWSTQFVLERTETGLLPAE